MTYRHITYEIEGRIARVMLNRPRYRNAQSRLMLEAHVQAVAVPLVSGPRKTKEILFQNRFVTAQEAMELGFVNRGVPRAELDEETTELAERIAESNTFTLRITKCSVNQAHATIGFRT